MTENHPEGGVTVYSLALSGANAANFRLDGRGYLYPRDKEDPTIDMVMVLRTKPYGTYQRTSDGRWFIWRGKRGWLRVRNKAMLEWLK